MIMVSDVHLDRPHVLDKLRVSRLHTSTTALLGSPSRGSPDGLLSVPAVR